MNKLAFCIAIAAFSTGALMAGASEGKALYDTKCKTCHGPEGQGNPGMAKMMKVEMKPLGSAAIQGKSDADIKTVILKGGGKMKPVAVTDKQADDLVAFVRTLKK